MATIKHLEKQAKAMYIHASEIKPTSQTWLGVGKACYLLKEYSEAEDALSVQLKKKNKIKKIKYKK